MHSVAKKVDRSVADALSAIQSVLSVKNEFLYADVIAGILSAKDYGDICTIGNNHIERAIDRYMAKGIAHSAQDLLKLHSFLVASGSTMENPKYFGHADRYGAAFAKDVGFKTMAFQTQNYTYMVMLVSTSKFMEDDSGEFKIEKCWNVHMRYATQSRYSTDPIRLAFDQLNFLLDKEQSGAEKYCQNAHEYFRYHDIRDRGYLCSVAGRGLSHMWDMEGAMYSYSMLKIVFFDLMCHASMCVNEV